MNEIDLLKWAVGAPSDLPGFAGVQDDRILYMLGINEDFFLKLLAQHRLAPRFLNRYRQEHPGWCSPALLGRVLDLGAQAQRQTRDQLDALRQITKALGPTELPLISIKGFTAYALTGDNNALRLSADMDLLYPDLELLWETLVRLGFSGQKRCRNLDEYEARVGNLLAEDAVWHPPGIADEHEFAKMTRGSLSLELHRFFPTYAYPQGLGTADLDPGHHSGGWVQGYADVVESQILYEDLLEHRTYGVTPETSGLAVPDATMSVFLLCVHLGKHCLFVPPSQDKMPLKLVELVEIRELVEHVSFDRAGFLRLAARFHGEDAIGFVNYLLNVYLDADTLGFAVRQRPKGPDCPLPRLLTWWQCWAAYDTAEALLFPDDMSGLVSRLGANTVMATTDGTRQTYTLLGEAEGQAIARFILYSPQGHRVPVQFAVTFEAEALCFEIRFLEPLPDDDHYYSIELQFGCNDNASPPIDRDYRETIFRQSPGWSAGLETLAASGSAQQYCSHHCFCRDEWSPLLNQLRSQKSLPALLILGLQNSKKPNYAPFDWVVTLPLHICL